MGKFQELPEREKNHQKQEKLKIGENGMIGVTLRSKLSRHQSPPEKSF